MLTGVGDNSAAHDLTSGNYLGILDFVTEDEIRLDTASFGGAAKGYGGSAVSSPSVHADTIDLAPAAPVAATTVSVAEPQEAAAVANFYVATNGKDTNAGTINAPLATITRAVALAGPGDVISVRGGVYTGQQANIWKSGTKDNPITIQAQAGEHVVLDGSGTKANTDLVAITGSYITFSGFEVQDATRTGISVYGVHDVKLTNNIVHDTQRGGIYLGGWQEYQSYNQIVQGNIVYHTALENISKQSTAGWARALAVDVTTNSTISQNKVFENHGEGVGALSSSKLTYSNNVVYDNYSVQMYFDNSQYITATGNKVFHTNETDYFRAGKPGVGMLIANEYTTYQKYSTGYDISGNTLSGVGSPKYDGSYGWGGGLGTSSISNNTINANWWDIDWNALYWG